MEGFAQRVRGCLLAGAIGDALGYQVEFSSLRDIRQRYGPGGIRDLDRECAKISDDTQMTLFTVEGLIEARGTAPVESVYRAHRRWLRTQLDARPPAGATGLAAQKWLYEQRAPGRTCMSGLLSEHRGTVENPANPDSKGCGAVMRSAPFGLAPDKSPRQVFDEAMACAVHTHGHRSGYLAAGALAALVRHLLDGAPLGESVYGTRELLVTYPGHDEVSGALDAAIAAADRLPAEPATVAELGQGWVAEEALAIAVYCALTYPDDVRRALPLAVNHDGDSDSTGAICGNILGARLGDAAVPGEWLEVLEEGAWMAAYATDFAAVLAP